VCLIPRTSLSGPVWSAECCAVYIWKPHFQGDQAVEVPSEVPSCGFQNWSRIPGRDRGGAGEQPGTLDHQSTWSCPLGMPKYCLPVQCSVSFGTLSTSLTYPHPSSIRYPSGLLKEPTLSPSFPFSLSLSLSHIHTHTHTHTP
jgi:hypothetical protein